LNTLSAKAIQMNGMNPITHSANERSPQKNDQPTMQIAGTINTLLVKIGITDRIIDNTIALRAKPTLWIKQQYRNTQT